MALVQKQFGDLITFTRSSAGGRFNERGIYEMVPANQPRFNYDPATLQPLGILIEESRTNLILNSGDISLFQRNGGATTGPSAEILPDGTLMGTEVGMSGNSGSGVYRANVPNSGRPSTYSIFVKPLTGNGMLRLTMEGAAYAGLGAGSVAYDLLKETYSPAGPAGEIRGGIKKLSNGWFRIYMSRSVSNNSGGLTNITFYAGDVETKTFAVWGGQLEPGVFPTSYIPTQASQVTRTADVVAISQLSPWYNPTGGTLLVSGQGNEVNGTLAEFSNGSTTERWIFALNREGAFTVVNGNLPTFSRGVAGSDVKIGGALSGGSALVSINGSPSISGTNTPTPLCSLLTLGRRNNGTSVLNGHIRDVRYYPSKLTDAELQALTK